MASNLVLHLISSFSLSFSQAPRNEKAKPSFHISYVNFICILRPSIKTIEICKWYHLQCHQPVINVQSTSHVKESRMQK